MRRGGGGGPLIQIEKSLTLGCNNDQTIFCMATQQGGAECRCDDKAPTLTAAAGMSGNNQPIICDGFKAGNGAKANGIGYEEEKAPTLSAANSGTNQVPAIIFDPLPFDTTQITSPQNRSNVHYGDPCHPLAAKAHPPAIVKYTCHATNLTVRRLAPVECERLQGYPDGWTDIGQWTDSKGKRHKESSDNARYKALGNSIALPPWAWVLKRICACYERPATMASIFDGIGGFPLIWERLNGKGTCLWASEIEEFPIAVTKRRLTDEG